MPAIPYENIPTDVFACMNQTQSYVKKSSNLNRGLMELIRYRVSSINQCAYCMDMHFKDAKVAGESDMRIYSVNVWWKAPFYTEQEQHLLAWAETMTTLSTASDRKDETMQKLMAFLSVQEIANFTLAIAQINSWNRLATAFGFKVGSYQVGQFDH